MSFNDFLLRRRILVSIHKFQKFTSEKNGPRWIIFTSDILICLLSVLLSYSIRFNFKFDLIDNSSVLFNAGIIISVRIIYSLIFRVYAHVIRYTSIYDLKRILYTIGTGSMTILLITLILRHIDAGLTLPFSVIVMELFITLFLMIYLRLFVRYIYFLVNNLDLDSHATLIIGSKDLAVILKDALEIKSKENYKPVAFVDSKISCKNKRLAGLSIKDLKDLQFLVEKDNISHFIIAKQDISQKEKEFVVDIAKKYKIKMLSAPDLWNIPATGNVNIEEINMDELLARKPIKLDKNHLKDAIKGKRVLITGAAGSIGSELVRQIVSYDPKNLILIDQAETPLYDIELEVKENYKFKDYSIVLADILNKKRIEKIFKTFRPEIVYHAAAYKHVPMMENNPIEAFQNNVMGSRILADLSHKYNVGKFIMVSTDKAVNPTGIMGATKRIAEIYIQSLNSVSKTNFITTRFGNVLNSNGSVIPRFLKQIKDGGPVTVTHPEITRFFMTIPEACQLVLEASIMGQGGEIYLFDMGKAVKILELAKNLIRSTGHIVNKDIEIQFTGLRPGEKLYEELLLETEANKPTHHPKIKIAEVCPHYYEEIEKQLNRFAFPVENQNITEVVSLMKQLVPTYKSKNSVFESLDKAV